MGLFGGSKTYVASTVYNLAGPEADRVKFLQTSIAANVLFNSKFSMSETLHDTYLAGPGIKARNFYRWAVNNYSSIGVPPMQLTIVDAHDDASVEAQIPNLPGETADLLEVQQGNGDITYWAERFIADNHPTRLETDWTLAYDEVTEIVTITFTVDSFVATFTASSPDMEAANYYFYVSYNRLDGAGAIIQKAVWIYRVGDGNAYMDSLVGDQTETSYFFPFIPIRFKNEFLSTTYYPDAYALSKRAYKKATGGGDYDELIAKIADNEDIDDVDHAYIVYGVPLNVVDNSARRYLFTFFEGLIPNTVTGSINRIQVKSPGSFDTKMDFVITWDSITKTTGTGLKKPGAKNGEVWITNVGDTISINWQTSLNSWETITVADLLHDNTVYKTKSVFISASEALADPDESGFLVPLHYETVRNMSLVDSTQMMTASTFVVFNSYQVVKQRWYETGIFKIFVFVVIIALTIVFAPAGGALMAGYAAIGAAIGLTGLAAIIAGAVISQLAAMLLMRILTVVSVEIFGEKFGMIIAAVAAVAISVVGPGMLAGQNMSTMWGQMMSAPNLMKLTSALGNGVSQYVQASAQDTMSKTEELIKTYEAESKRINDLYAENIGYGKVLIDPMWFTNFLVESEAQFLSRTLLTGTDIAEMSMDMLTNFTNYTLSLK